MIINIIMIMIKIKLIS